MAKLTVDVPEGAELKYVYEAPRWTVSLGYTLNVGNFQSFRIDIGHEDSVRPGESTKTAFQRIYQDVTEEFLERIREEREALEKEGLA